MMLELRHISPYLPYSIKGIFTNLPNGRLFELTEIIINKDNDDYDDNIDVSGKCGVYGGETADISNFKPILRSMSDLHDISLNWKQLASEEWAMINNDDYVIQHDFTRTEQISVKFYFALIQNHFDVFGLIDKGLAIDINTL